MGLFHITLYENTGLYCEYISVIINCNIPLATIKYGCAKTKAMEFTVQIVVLMHAAL